MRRPGNLRHAAKHQDVVIVRRRGGPDVALIPAEELTELMETAHLLRSPANAKRLLSTATNQGWEGQDFHSGTVAAREIGAGALRVLRHARYHY